MRTFASLLSTQTTSFPLSAKHAPATRPTYPVPTTAIFNRFPQKEFEAEKLSSHGAVQILVDYRPALRARTGVGEYMHEIIRAYTATHDDQVVAFTSSWRDRADPGTGERLGARVVDRRVPVRVLNFLWHRLQWPPVEALAGSVDVAHAAHPLMIPSRRAARVVTVHD